MKTTKELFNATILGKDSLDQHAHPSTTKLPRWPEVSRTGEIVKTSIANVRAFLECLGFKLWLDEFENRIRIDGLAEHRYLDAHLLASLWGQANELGFRPSPTFMRQALMSIAVENRRHPVREYLGGLVRWDGVQRAERLFIDYANAEDNALNRAIGKLLLVAMVRRILKPGCKFDYMVILQGPEGCMKSTFCKTLAGGSEFFEESLTLTASVKQLMENTAGKLVVEIAELKGLTPKDIEHHKALITRTHDRSRLCRRDFAETVPRQFVIIGTTNEEVFLCDSTGNRRYLPVRVSNIDIEALERDRDQLLAEACEREKTYGPLIIPTEFTEELRQRQEEATIVDPVCERLSDYISDKLSVNPQYNFRKNELYEVMRLKNLGPQHGKLIANVARKHGLVKVKRGPKAKREEYYIPAAETKDS
jgi:predicted P-loop ATPase